MTRLLLLAGIIVATLATTTATAQYVFLDTTGDGLCDFPFEPLGSAETAVDVWIDTGTNADGSAATCPTGEDLTIASYEVVLYSAGTAQIGAWTNAIPQFTEDLGVLHEGPWIRVGFTSSAGATHLPPGKHRLGSLVVAVSSGCPYLQIAASGGIFGTTYYTQFYSACPGKEGEGFVKFGVDFADACAAGPICDEVKSGTWGQIKTLYR